MNRLSRSGVGLVALVALAWCQVVLTGAALAAPVQLSPDQQQAADKLKAKGGSVMQLAADSDALVVELGLAGKQIGDEDVALVKGLPKVVELDLHGTSVTDNGLAAVEGLKDLTRLRLDRTQITDAGLAHLKDLNNLVYLNLYGTPVTDAGLDQLKGLKSLKSVYLWQTKVTDAGADALRKALPGATVNKGEGMAALAAVSGPAKPSPESEKPKPAPDKPKTGDLKLDDEGFIRDWLLLAPIPTGSSGNGAPALDAKQLPNEADLKPKDGEKAKAGDRELAWKTVKASDYLFDLNSILGQATDNAVAYAVAYVDSPDEKKDVQLLIGSDDEAKLYLNGKEVLKATTARGLAKDQDKATGLTLNKGTNVLVFKVVNEAGGWQGCARLADKDGKPIKDLKLKLEP